MRPASGEQAQPKVTPQTGKMLESKHYFRSKNVPGMGRRDACIMTGDVSIPRPKTKILITSPTFANHLSLVSELEQASIYRLSTAFASLPRCRYDADKNASKERMKRMDSHCPL